MHGRWPSYCDESYGFREEDLGKKLVEELRQEWPTFYTDTNPMFWGQEWSKHGTCSLDVLPTEREYFETVLELHRQFDLAVSGDIF